MLYIVQAPKILSVSIKNGLQHTQKLNGSK